MKEPYSRTPHRVQKDDSIPPLARLIFGVLDGLMHKATGRCNPPVSKIAAWVGCSERHVTRNLNILEAAGWIRILRHSGRRNEYDLLPEAAAEPSGPPTPDMDVRGPADVTPDMGVRGTPDMGVRGPADSPYKGLKELGGRSPAPPKPQSLFAEADRDWLRRGVDYFLEERPELVHLRGWFAGLIAEFFLGQSWQRPTDPETAFLWAKRFAAIGATPEEVQAALEWAGSASPVDGHGKKIFSRPDYLERIVYRIQSQRRRQAQPEAAADPEPAIGAAAAAWQAASEEQREEVRRRLKARGRSPGGPLFEAECHRELQRSKQPVAEP